MKPKLKIKNTYFIELPLKIDKKRGNLSFGEAQKNIPFSIKRIYWITDVPVKTQRGGHAHKQTEQVLFCLHGVVELTFDNGYKIEKLLLSRSNRGVFIGKLVWHNLRFLQKDTIVLVIASTFYKEKDYIRDYKVFKTLLN